MLRIERRREEFACRATIMFRRTYNSRKCYWRAFRRDLPHEKRVHRRVVDATRWPRINR